ncbi:Sec-independent protein translocase protein TatB [Usitatibacter palustris]|uniref:Sec-independent protein translocase protein TatB n=1 Tax=Usitatibacter palustris TaxID=2732487 RepID=A0A6M4HC91_9PROT|nr:Sec-independent protein translocase protein TatB [Usitatibacter palustris]QJR16368.1 Sec-independent protein translocase protein TatB [Usitatibacter palustris]
MFDIGFSELLVVGVVALVVIGPERLPRVARTLGHLFGRLQRYVTQVKSDINREMDLTELNRAKKEFEGAANSFRSDMESKATETEREIRDVQSQIDREMQPTTPPADASPAAAETAVSPELVSEPPPSEPASPQLELGIEDTYANDGSRKSAG